MTGTALAALFAFVLFCAFLVGWVAHWGWSRLAHAASPLEDRVRELTAELLHVEAERDAIRAEAVRREAEMSVEFSARETALEQNLREREAELAASMETVAALRQGD